jgi:hypothetical protein
MIIDGLKRFYSTFTSPRVTAAIIAVVMLLFFTGLIIPQKSLILSSGGDYGTWRAQYPLIASGIELLHLNEIYTAPITIFCLALFFSNLVAVLIRRVPVIIQRMYLSKKGLAELDGDTLKKRSGALMVESPQGSSATIALLKKKMKGRFWSCFDLQPGQSFVAIKNRYSPIGFLLFHLSFILCLAGGLLVSYTRFSGNLVLTEGQRFDSDMKAFYKVTKQPKIFQALPSIGIDLEKVNARYVKDVAVDLDVRMKVAYLDNEENVIVKINQPVRRGSTAILAQNSGMSPLFILSAPGGKEIDGGYFSLNVQEGGEDSFEFPGRPYRFFVRFYPDHAVEDDGKDYSRTREINNPVAHVRIEKEKKTMYDGYLRLGERIKFDNIFLGMNDVRRWVDFLIVREYGTIPLFIGFLFGVLGLLLRLVFYQKILYVSVEGDENRCFVWIDGRSEHYTYSFNQELSLLQLELAKAVGASSSVVSSKEVSS